MATKFEKLMRGLIETRSSWDAVFLRNVGRDQMDYDVMDSPYQKSDLVYTCVSTTGRAVSQVPLLRYDQKGKDEYEPVYSDDPWQSLLDNPNPLMDGYRFKEAIVSYYLLEGNAFVIPFPPQSMGGRGGVPESLYVVGSDHMKPVRNETTGQLDGWIYLPKGEQRDKYILGLHEVIHFRTWHPDDPIMGMSPLEAGGLHVKVDYKAAIFNEKFFDNAAVPAGMITTPAGVGFGDKKRERLKSELEAVHTGYRRAFRLMFLEKGLKYEKIGATHQEMMFKDLRFMSRESIMQAFGMKKAVISVTEDLNYATAEAQKKAWWEDTLIPIMSMIASGFTHYLMGADASKIFRRKRVLVTTYGKQKGLELFRNEIKELREQGKEAKLASYFDFDTSGVKALQDDFDKKVETAAKLARMGFTGNELNQRLELGFDEDKPWRDSWWVQQAFVPVGEEFGEEPEESPESEPEKPEPEQPVEGDEVPIEIEPESISDNSANKDLETKAQSQWRRFTDRMSPIEAKYQGKIERFFWEIRRKSLRYLLKYHDPEGLMKEEFDEETRSMVKWVTPLYREAIAAGVRSASEEVVEALTDLEEQRRGVKEKGLKATFSIDVDFLMENDPEVLNYMMERIDRIGVGKRREGQLTETVRRQIIDELHKGQQAAEGIQELADRIKGKLKGNVSRAKTIARTETISAANHGRNLTFKRSGFTRRIWFTSGDHLVRDSHRAMESHPPIPMDEPWIVGGCSLRYPCDYEAGCPDQTINCRCTESVDPDSHPAFQEKPQMIVQEEQTRPKGYALGEKIDVTAKYKKNVLSKHNKTVSGIIDEIHGTNDLDSIKFTWNKPEWGYDAAYDTDGVLHLHKQCSVPHMSMLHEIGHWLDNTALRGVTSFGSEEWATATTKEKFNDFFKAVRSTDLWKALDEAVKTGTFSLVDATGKIHTVSPMTNYASYLMRDKEIWARAYAQYIATKSKNSILIDELAKMYKRPATYGHWATFEDFEPVYDAIERLLKTEGWME